jgi:transcriptional regulator with XRE-family HTH domain
MPTTSPAVLRRFKSVADKHAARVGARIKARREHVGLTQSALARLLPTADSNQVSRWERGLHTPNPDTLELIAEILGVTYVDLVALAEEPRTASPYPEGGVPEMMEHIIRLEEIAKGHAGGAQVEKVRAEFRGEVGEMQDRLSNIENGLADAVEGLRKQYLILGEILTALGTPEGLQVLLDAVPKLGELVQAEESTLGALAEDRAARDRKGQAG